MISRVGGGVPWSLCSLAAGSHRSTSLRCLSLWNGKTKRGAASPKIRPRVQLRSFEGCWVLRGFCTQVSQRHLRTVFIARQSATAHTGKGEASRIPRLWQPSAGCQASQIAWSSWTSTARYHRSTSNDIAFKQIARNHPTHSVVSSLGLRKLGFDHLEGVGDDRWPRQLSGVVRKVQMKARLIASALEKPQAGRSRPVLFRFPPTSVAQLQYVSAKPTEPAKLPALA